MTSYTEVPTAVDDRFRRRSVYWRPGMSVIAEPWVSLADTNVGHVVVPQGRHLFRAAEQVATWETMARLGHATVQGIVVVAAAVVDPRGDVRDWWALDPQAPAPVPGGAPRYSPLHRVLAERACGHCGAPRHPGTWVSWDPPGCARCLPEREGGDRPWPTEAPLPLPVLAHKRKAARSPEPPPDVPSALPSLVDSPPDGRLL